MGGSLLRRKWHHLTFHAELSSRNKSPQKLILDLQKHWTIHSGSNDSKRIRATRWPTKGTFLVIFQTLCLKCCEERLLMALILQEALRETCCRALKMCASPWNAICLATKSLLEKSKMKVYPFWKHSASTNFCFAATLFSDENTFIHYRSWGHHQAKTYGLGKGKRPKN